MADSFVRVPQDSTGKRVDAASLDVGANTVYRQRIVIASDTETATFATVTTTTPSADAPALVVRNVATGASSVTGVVAISGTAAVSIAATVNVAGTVSLGASSAVIGILDSISKTVNVAIATPFTLQGISTTVNVAVATPFTVQGISTTVNVAVATPFTIDAISRTAQVAIGTPIVVNNISATVNVAGNLTFSGGVDYISRTTIVAVSTPFTLNNISATVVVAGSVNISATAIIAGNVTIATTATVTGNVNLSATATVGLGYVLEAATNAQVYVGDSANSAIRVNIVAGGGSGGTSQLDGTSFSTQAALFTPIGGIFDDTTPNTLSENDAGVVRLTSYRAFHVNLRDNDGNQITAGNALQVSVVNATSTSTVVLGAGSATIGTVVAVRGGIAVMSGSHGPKCVTASTSANVTLIASPGTGANIYVTQLMVGNNSSTKTLARIGTSASISTVVQPLAADGGGFVLNFDPPWMLSASEAAVCSVKPNVSQVYFTVNFYVK